MIKYTFKDFKEQFGIEEKCLEFLIKNKYKNNICPVCGSKIVIYKVKRMKYHLDTRCQHRFSILADTPLRGNRTSLVTIFHIIFLLSIAKNGLSAMEVQRHFGMTYKTAWALLNKIRQTLANNELLSGVIEMDETYYGGSESNKHSDKKRFYKKINDSYVPKRTLIGLKSRKNGNIIVNSEIDRKTNTIEKNIKNNVKNLETLITDEWQAYKTLAIKNKLTHLTIEHKYEWYGRKMMNTTTGEIANINTNGIEGVWSTIKNSLKNTYKRPSAKFLQSYLDEFSFRFNQRKNNVFLKMAERAFCI